MLSKETQTKLTGWICSWHAADVLGTWETQTRDTWRHGDNARTRSTRVNQLKNAWAGVPLMTEEIEQRESKGTMLRHCFALERYGSVSFRSLPHSLSLSLSLSLTLSLALALSLSLSLTHSPSRSPFCHLFTNPCSTTVRWFARNCQCARTFCQAASSRETAARLQGRFGRRVRTLNHQQNESKFTYETNHRAQHPHSTIGNLRPCNCRDQITSAGESSAALRRNRESDGFRTAARSQTSKHGV